MLPDLPPKYKRQLSMFFEECRLASFKNWVYDNDQPCSAAKMAEAGFYSIATKKDPDAVQCFLCGKTLDGWEADDDPWMEHLSHAKHCAFAQIHLPELDLTMKQMAELKIKQIQGVFHKHIDEVIEERFEAWNDLLRTIKDKGRT